MPFILLLLFLYFSSSANDDIPAKTIIDSNHFYYSSLLKDGTLITAGMVCGLAASFVEYSVKPLSAREINALTPESVNQFDRSATRYYSPVIDDYSDLLTGALIAAPFGLLANSAIRKEVKTVASMYLEILLFSYALPSFGKGVTERKRPFVYNPLVPLEKKREKDAYASFFSRHTTYAFASSVFLSTLYGSYNPDSPFKPCVWAISLMGASTAGFMRYRAGAHFPTDILTGAAVGSLIGYGIPWLHERKNSRTQVSVDPFQQAICLYWQF